MTDLALATRDNDELRVFSLDGFEMAQRMAKSLASSTLVPKIYQGQEGLANCLIALELSSRMKISPMVVMQNMVPIHGRPSWSSQFLIGTVNACGRFSPLRYIFDNEDEPTSCYCEAKDLASNEILRGEKITIAMAKAQGWWSRKDSKGAETSKWPTMTGQMLRFRAASWWVRVFCPEISLGLGTQEEAIDVEAVTVSEVPAAAIAPAVPEPLAHRAAEHAEAAEPTQAPEPQPVDLQPEPTPAAQSAPIDTQTTPAAQPVEAGNIFSETFLSELGSDEPDDFVPSDASLIAASTYGRRQRERAYATPKPTSSGPEPAEPGTSTAPSPQPEPAPAPAVARRVAPQVRRASPAALPAAEAPISGLD